jgi:nucleotide-binding universal stress UspA family protein
MILICYDGSKDARAAVEHAAELFSGEPVTVLTVWQPFIEVVARSCVGFGMVPSIPDADEIDEASSKAADQTAAEGAELATTLGMNAQPRSCAQETTTARAILDEADRIGASAIVMDSRGLTGGQVAAAWERLARGDPARRPDRGGRALAGGRGPALARAPRGAGLAMRSN